MTQIASADAAIVNRRRVWCTRVGARRATFITAISRSFFTRGTELACGGGADRQLISAGPSLTSLALAAAIACRDVPSVASAAHVPALSASELTG